MKDLLINNIKEFLNVPGIYYIKEWESIKIAETTLKIKNIHRAASKNRTAGSFKWRFE